jgi:translation initiation factor 1A
MLRKPVTGNTEEVRLRLPRKNELEMFGIIVQLHGSGKVRVLGEDNTERVCRIPGKLRKRVWMREGDIVIIKLWEFQKTKADVVWRYIGVQTENLRRKGFLNGMPF